MVWGPAMPLITTIAIVRHPASKERPPEQKGWAAERKCSDQANGEDDWELGCEWQVKRINCCGIWTDNATLIMISICADINPIKRRRWRANGRRRGPTSRRVRAQWLVEYHPHLYSWMDLLCRNWFIATCYKLFAIAVNMSRGAAASVGNGS